MKSGTRWGLRHHQWRDCFSTDYLPRTFLQNHNRASYLLKPGRSAGLYQAGITIWWQSNFIRAQLFLCVCVCVCVFGGGGGCSIQLTSNYSESIMASKTYSFSRFWIISQSHWHGTKEPGCNFSPKILQPVLWTPLTYALYFWEPGSILGCLFTFRKIRIMRILSLCWPIFLCRGNKDEAVTTSES